MGNWRQWPTTHIIVMGYRQPTVWVFTYVCETCIYMYVLYASYIDTQTWSSFIYTTWCVPLFIVYKIDKMMPSPWSRNRYVLIIWSWSQRSKAKERQQHGVVLDSSCISIFVGDHSALTTVTTAWVHQSWISYRHDKCCQLSSRWLGWRCKEDAKSKKITKNPPLRGTVLRDMEARICFRFFWTDFWVQLEVSLADPDPMFLWSLSFKIYSFPFQL